MMPPSCPSTAYTAPVLHRSVVGLRSPPPDGDSKPCVSNNYDPKELLGPVAEQYNDLVRLRRMVLDGLPVDNLLVDAAGTAVWGAMGQLGDAALLQHETSFADMIAAASSVYSPPEDRRWEPAESWELLVRWFPVAQTLSSDAAPFAYRPHLTGLSGLLGGRHVDEPELDNPNVPLGSSEVFMSYLHASDPQLESVLKKAPEALTAAPVDEYSEHLLCLDDTPEGCTPTQVVPSEGLRRKSFNKWVRGMGALGWSDRQVARSLLRPVCEAHIALMKADTAVLNFMGPRTPEIMGRFGRWTNEVAKACESLTARLRSYVARPASAEHDALSAQASAVRGLLGQIAPPAGSYPPNPGMVFFEKCGFVPLCPPYSDALGDSAQSGVAGDVAAVRDSAVLPLLKVCDEVLTAPACPGDRMDRSVAQARRLTATAASTAVHARQRILRNSTGYRLWL